MFKPKKTIPPSELPNVRLPKLGRNPAFEEIQDVLSRAEKFNGRTIELPFSSPSTGGSYLLAVVYDRHSGQQPLWKMHIGDNEYAKLCWEYSSGDLQLILNLVLGESTGGQLQDTVALAGSYMAAQKPGEHQAEAPHASSTIGGAYPSHQLDPSLTDTGTRVKAILEGDLKNMQVPNLLQTVLMSKMTGHLNVLSSHGSADLYFEDGTPVHAQTGSTSGDAGILELLLWEDGEFKFLPEERTRLKTVNKRLESLLMEGIALLDQDRYLTAQGLNQNSYLMRKNNQLTEAQFEQMVSLGAPIDLGLQKRIYQLIDNRCTLSEILRKMPLPKTEWIPAFYNFVSCGLVGLAARAPLATQETTLPLEELGVDKAAIEAVVRSLQRAETGLFTFPALLYFLEQEALRFKNFQWPLSLIVFELRFRPTGPSGPLEPLPIQAVKEIVKRIHAIKRSTDLIAHFETFDYACLLANTNSAAAGIFSNQIGELIRATPVPGTPDVRSISLWMGVAAMPDDCTEPGLLLAAAKKAKQRAKEINSTSLLYRDIRNS